MAHELIAGSTKIRSQHITNHQHMISHHQLSKYCLQISYHHIVIYRSIQAKSRFTEHQGHWQGQQCQGQQCNQRFA